MTTDRYGTPRTRLTWSTLEDWYKTALALALRRPSAANSHRKHLHVAALPLHLISACSDREILNLALQLLRYGPQPFRQPPRGQRNDAPHTALIVAITNRLDQLAAHPPA